MRCTEAIELEQVLVHTEGDRILNVSILNNGCIIFKWSNGDPVPRHIIKKYCRQINNAKTTLEGRIRDRQRAHGLNLLTFQTNDGKRDGIYSFPSTRSENSEGVAYTYPERMVPQKPCKVDHKSNLVKPIHVL